MQNPIIQDIYNFIQEHKLIPEGSRVVLGLSGGPDSVFLLHFLADLQRKRTIELIAAHLDHEWRPESAQDTQFCKKITDELGIPFISVKASELDVPFKMEGSREELGRNMRRYFLEKVATEHKANLIALAHHLQDQEETFFIRLLRGTTLTGLCGMWPKHGLYIRPLLDTDKNEIVKYLEDHGISYLVDPSNIEDIYLRNRIRNNVLPALRETDDRFDTNFVKTINHLQQAETFLEQITCEIFNNVTCCKNDKRILLLDPFFELEPYLQKRILVQWLCSENAPFKPSDALFEEIIRFAHQPGSKTHELHHAWTIVKKKNQLIIEHM